MSNVRTYKKVALATGALFLYMVALVFRQPQLFFMCSVLLLTPLLSYGFARASLRRLRCVREAPDRLVEDATGEVCLRLTNEGWLPKFMLRVTDHLPAWLETAEDTQAECFVPVLLWKESFEHRYRVTATLRGRHRLGPAAVQAIDLFDLFTTRATVGEPQDLIVYPSTVPVREDPYRGGQKQGLMFLPSAAVFSEGVDFYSTREYQPGDDLRRIHWRTTARRDQFFVIEFEQNFSTNLLLLLDAQRGIHVGVGRQSTLEYGVKLAASLAQHELERGHAAGLLARGDAAIDLPVVSGDIQLSRVLEALAVIQPEGATPLAELLTAAARECPPEATAVLISPSTDLGIVTAVANLRARNVHIVYLWLDPRSFLAAHVPPSSPGRPPRGSLPEAADGFAAALMAAGARVYMVRQGADLGFPEEIRHAYERPIRASA